MTTELQPIQKNGKLQFSKIEINEDYRKKWNITSNDFVCLSRNGEPIRNTLYRLGGLNNPNLDPNKEKYFMLLKHVEDIYDFDFIKKCYPEKSNKQLELQRKHLKSFWCILDSDGNEKVEFKQFEHAYLVNNSCIYSLDQYYYNIETGEFYCRTSSSMETSEFLFLENKYDKDKSKRGVMKINKKDGSFELFPE